MRVYRCVHTHTCRRTSFPSWRAGFLSVPFLRRGGWDWHAASGFGSGSRFASLRVGGAGSGLALWRELGSPGSPSKPRKPGSSPLPQRVQAAGPALSSCPPPQRRPTSRPTPTSEVWAQPCSGTPAAGDSVRCPPGASRGRHLPDTRLGAPHRAQVAQPLSWPSGAFRALERSKAGAPAGGY